MSELLQFSLLDMTPYDRQSWFNLIADYYEAIWPAYFVAPLFIIAMLYLLFKPKPLICIMQLISIIRPSSTGTLLPVRLAIGMLGVSWFWCGAIFHLQHFSNLNWAASWFAFTFMSQGLLLMFAAALIKRAAWVSLASLRGCLAIFLLLVGLIIYPLSGLLEGRNLMQLEWFPLLPSSVTLVSFALIILLDSRWRHVLVVIPLIWGVVSAAFATTLGLLEFYFMTGAMVLWLSHLFMRATSPKCSSD